MENYNQLCSLDDVDDEDFFFVEPSIACSSLSILSFALNT